jgi:transposase-like protein
MNLSIQLHLSVLSLLNTVSILEVFDAECARSTVRNWVHKANLQPKDGQELDYIAVDKTVIQLNDEQYWLYAVVDPKTNK